MKFITLILTIFFSVLSFATEDKKTDAIVKYVIGKSADSSYQNYTKLYQEVIRLF